MPPRGSNHRAKARRIATRGTDSGTSRICGNKGLAVCVQACMSNRNFAARVLLLALLPALPLMTALPALGQTEGDCGTTLTTTLLSGASLGIDSISLGMEIVPVESDSSKTTPEIVRVSCTSRREDADGRVHLKLSNEASGLHLRVTGDAPSHGNLQLRIEVPKRTNLRVRMAAGQITIDGVEGDKDCELTAGQITITDHRQWNYRAVDASVDIGEVNAAAYDREMGGFFRHFLASSDGGEYALPAHVGTGQVELLGTAQKHHGYMKE